MPLHLSWVITAAFVFYMYGAFLLTGIMFPTYIKVPETWEELVNSNYTVAMVFNTSMYRSSSIMMHEYIKIMHLQVITSFLYNSS